MISPLYRVLQDLLDILRLNEYRVMARLSQDGVPLMSILNALILGGGALVAYLMYMWKQSRSVPDVPWPKVPGARPIIGNDIGCIDNFTQIVEEWAGTYGKETGIYEFVLFGIRFIVPCTEEKIKLIEKERPFNITRAPGVTRAVNSIGADGLFSAEGAMWRKDRKMVAPSLNRKNVHDYLAMVKLVAQRLVKKWDCHATEGRAVSINKDILASTLDITSLVAFSNDIDSLRTGSSILGNYLLRLFKAIVVRTLLPFPYYHIPIIGQYLDGAGFTRDRTLRYFTSLVEDHEASPVLGDGEKKNFLAKLVALRKKDSTTLTHKRLVGNLITMFFAGGETTFVTICSALYEIAMDRTNLQNDLAEEALLLNGFDEAGLEELTNGLPRLRSMIYETLRIRGPTPLLDTATTTKFELDGCVLPPNTRILLIGRFISTLDSKDGTVGTPRGPLNASPAEFCARRWLSSDGDASDEKVTVATPSFRTGYRAFGSGKRVCPGRDLAETETLVILASILRSFEISLEEGHPPMTLVSRFTQSPDIDIRLVLKPRLKPMYAK